MRVRDLRANESVIDRSFAIGGASRCDLNGDVNTNVLDVQTMVTAILGCAPPSGYGLNGDGRLDLAFAA